MLALLTGKPFSFQAGLKQVRTSAIGAEFLAARFDAERLLHGAKSESPRDAFVEDLEVVVLELDDFPAVDTDEVIVRWLVEKVGIVGRLAVAQVDFLEEPSLGQERKGAIDGGP